MSRRALVVDDEKSIVKGLKFSLEQEGVKVDCAYDGEEAVELVRTNIYDIILLDIMLPKLSGFEVCQQIREFSSVPIIILTAKSDDIDKILGLEYGADDYITKPFNILEVKARIKAIMRRADIKNSEPKLLSFGDLVLNEEYKRVHLGEVEINLTGREFEVLEFLAKTPGKVYGREELLRKIWGEDYLGDERTVDVHIRRLREKLEPNPSEPTYVRTKWGTGYYFQA